MRLLGFVIRLSLYLVLLSPFLLLVLIVLSLQSTSLVAGNMPLTAQEIQRVKTFISKNNPASFKENESRTTTVSENDANLLTRYALNKVDDRIQAQVTFSESSVGVAGTIVLPHNPLGDFINVATTLKQYDDEMTVTQLKVGDITIPNIVANFLLMRSHNMLQQKFPEYRTALNSLESLTLSPRKASMRYVWHSEIKDQLKNRITSTLIAEELKQPVAIYTKELVMISQSLRQSRPALTSLLQPMFTLAVERSKENNPVDENRALFIVLGAYMLDKNIVSLWDKTKSSSLPRKAFYLRNREDLSRHFLVSSAITALSDARLAQAIGLDKERSDANGGSGFSFADLAADRAGVVLAKQAFRSEKKARLIQQRLANTSQEDDFMPPIDRLPEGLEETDFKKRYTDTNNATYRNMVQVIDERIAACQLYR